MLCDNEVTDLGNGTFSHHCARCGKTSTTKAKLHYSTCRQVGILSKFKRVSVDFYRWMLSGFRTRNEAERERLLTICRACPMIRNKGAGEFCGKCGCKVNEKTALVNKLLWATSTCPLGKWGEK